MSTPIRRRRSTARAFALLTSLLLAAGCVGDSAGDAGKTFPNEITIGLLAPLTGVNEGAGKSARQGAELAKDMINSPNRDVPLPLAEGTGLPRLGGARVSIRLADTQGKKDVGARAAVDLVTQHKVTAVIGAYDPDVTMEASQRTERLNRPFLNADSSASYLTTRGLDWFFRLGPSIRETGEQFYSLLARERRQNKAGGKAVVLYTADPAGNDVASTVSELGEQNQVAVTRVGVPPGEQKFSSYIEQVKRIQPSVVFLTVAAASMPRLLSAFGSQTYVPDGVFAFRSGFLSPEFLTQASPVLNGICRETTWSEELADRGPGARLIADMYRSRFGMPMDEDAASAFTAVVTVAQAVDAAGSVDSEAVRNSLLALNVPGQDTIMPWTGISFDEQHQNVGADAIIEQYVGKEFRVVAPDDAATRTFIWPTRAAATAK